MYDFGIIGGLLYIEGELQKQNLWINKDHIVAINDNQCPAKEIYDAKGCLVLPGLIDPHVHFELGSGSLKSVDDFFIKVPYLQLMEALPHLLIFFRPY